MKKKSVKKLDEEEKIRNKFWLSTKMTTHNSMPTVFVGAFGTLSSKYVY
jgi:hypothetical protein